jgi:hypothetical protein
MYSWWSAVERRLLKKANNGLGLTGIHRPTDGSSKMNTRAFVQYLPLTSL